MDVEIELRAPAFLVAVPQLGDPNFLRAVVFILKHGDEGSMGLVINRSTDLAVAEFFEGQSLSFKGEGEGLVFQGGPVQTDRAFLLHSPGPEGPETEMILNAIRFSYSIESLEQIADTPPESVRMYLGYSGWGPGQLAAEIAEGAWLVAPPHADLIFADPTDDVWSMTLRRMGIEPVQLMHSGEMH